MTGGLGSTCLRFLPFVLACVCLPRTTQAQWAAPVPLEWTAPQECPPISFLRVEIENELQGSQSKREGITIHASARQLGFDLWQADLDVITETGLSKRVIRAQSCKALAQATSLIVAMLIDPEVAVHRSFDAQAGENPETQPSYNPPVASVTPGPNAGAWRDTTLAQSPISVERSRELRPAPAWAMRRAAAHFAVIAGADWGSLPSATYTYGFAVGYVGGYWQTEAGLSGWAERQATWNRPPAPSAGGGFWMMAGFANVCRGLFGMARWVVSPCAGLELRDLSGKGNDAVTVKNQTHRWSAAPTLSVLSSFELSEIFAVRLSLGAAVPLMRPAFEIDGLGSVFEPNWIALRANFGFEMRFR